MASSTIRKAIGVVKDQTSISIAKVAGNLAPDLEVLVVKATSHEEVPADDKYIREILTLTSHSRGYISASLITVSKRLTKTRDWIVAVKALSLVHRLLVDGHPAFEEEIVHAKRRGTRILNMSDFRDEAHSSSWDHAGFVRLYALYLDEKVEFVAYRRKLRGVAESEEFREEREEESNKRSEVTPVREMRAERVLERLKHLLLMLDRVLGCRPSGAAKNNRLVLVALYQVVRDSFKLYVEVCDVLGVLLDRFTEMEYVHCVKAFDSYVGAAKMMDELVGFYGWCKDMGIARSSEYPEVQRITDKLLGTLEGFLKEMSNRPKSPERKLEMKVTVKESEAEADMNEVKALPAPESESFTPPEAPPSVARPNNVLASQKETSDLVDLRDDGVSADEQGNKLALALFSGPATVRAEGSWEAFPSNEESEGKSAWETAAAEVGKADWELALVENSSNLSKQKAELGLDVEGDFQEAMEPREQAHDQGSELLSEEAVVDKQDDANTAGALTSALVDEKGPDVVQEHDSSEEADSENGKLGETDAIAYQDLERDGPGTHSVHLDGVASGVSGDGGFCDGSNGVVDDNLERSDGGGGKEDSGLNSDVEVVVKENGVVEDENSGLMSEKAEEVDDSEFMTPRQNGVRTLDDVSTDKEDDVDGVATEVIKSESSEVIPAEGTDAGDLKECDADPELGDDNIEVNLNASADSSGEIQDDTCEEVHGNSAHITLEQQDEVTRDVKDVTLGTDISHEDIIGEEMSTPGIQNAELTSYENGDGEHENSSFLDNPSTKETLPIQEASAADPKEGSNKDDQSQISDENQRDDDNSFVVEEPERTQEKIIQETETTQETGEQPVQPSADISSSTENSSAAGPRPLLPSSENSTGAGPRPVFPSSENSAASAGPRPVLPSSENSAVAGPRPVLPSFKNSAAAGPRPILPSSENSAAAGPTPVLPAGLGRAAPLLEPASRLVQQPRANGTVSNTQSQQMEDSSSGEAEEYDETREKLQMIRVKFLRLAHRLGQTPHNVVVAQVLYRLGLAEQLRGRNGGRVGAFSFDRASAMAEQLEAAGQEPLDFSCTIMVLGKTGVGKSATINSIFDEVKFNTSAFNMGTKKVQDVVGTVQGIKVRVIDTPGLLPSWSDQRSNEKILLSVKNFIKKTPPDIVLYLDRLDMQSRDFSDMPLLRTITEIFGPSIWFNAIVVLTHAASAPPEGPNGTASSYDMFVTQRSHVVQQAIRQAAGDMRLMNPVSLVENHSACRINRAGQRVLPNGQVWKPHLLLLSFASKILAEANALLKLQDSPPGKPYIARRAPPLPFLLSTLLQSRPQLKLPQEQFGDEDSLDDDLDEASESDDENEHDDLPPFKPLTKAQVEKLSKAHKKAYFDELEYREKLLMKKQLKEEKKRRKFMKKMAEAAKDLPSDYSENVEEEGGGAASVPVPMPDLALPASFDSDNPTHRYRYLDSSNQWLVRPVLETHGWDHDVGYEGLNVERLFVVKDRVPLSFTGQVTKDKKDANVQMEIAGSVKHGEGKATSLGFDMQTVGKDLAYTLRSETRFTNFRRNKATAGLSFTLLGDALSGGVKIEDKLVASKRFRVVISGGAMAGRNDIAYGGSLEAQLRDKDYPLGRFLSTLGLSVMDWHGDLAVGCNVQSQIPVGRHTNLVARANLNNRGAGQISIRLNSSEQLQIALVALIPLVKKLVGYPPQLQYGQY